MFHCIKIKKRKLVSQSEYIDDGTSIHTLLSGPPLSPLTGARGEVPAGIRLIVRSTAGTMTTFPLGMLIVVVKIIQILRGGCCSCDFIPQLRRFRMLEFRPKDSPRGNGQTVLETSHA